MGISADMIGRYAEYRLIDIAETIFSTAETADIRQQPKIGRTLMNDDDSQPDFCILVFVGPWIGRGSSKLLNRPRQPKT